MQRPVKAAPNGPFMLLLPWIHRPRKLADTDTHREPMCVTFGLSIRKLHLLPLTGFNFKFNGNKSCSWSFKVSLLQVNVQLGLDLIDGQQVLWVISSSNYTDFWLPQYSIVLWPGLKHRWELCIFLWLRGYHQGWLSGTDTWILSQEWKSPNGSSVLCFLPLLSLFHIHLFTFKKVQIKQKGHLFWVLVCHLTDSS